jgi:hypothetical protein
LIERNTSGIWQKHWFPHNYEVTAFEAYLDMCIRRYVAIFSFSFSFLRGVRRTGFFKLKHLHIRCLANLRGPSWTLADPSGPSRTLADPRGSSPTFVNLHVLHKTPRTLTNHRKPAQIISNARRPCGCKYAIQKRKSGGVHHTVPQDSARVCEGP